MLLIVLDLLVDGRHCFTVVSSLAQGKFLSVVLGDCCIPFASGLWGPKTSHLVPRAFYHQRENHRERSPGDLGGVAIQYADNTQL